MSVFDSIGSLYDDPSTDSVGDDNVAISSADTNPYVSVAVLGARNAYDTLHRLMGPLVKAKKSSLKQIDKWLDDWCAQLERIRKLYEDLLAKIKDTSANFGSLFTFDMAKEAWEILQDTPILRRYMGEANYWYLYDTLGLLATQSESLGADLSAGTREAIKKAILGLISMTDGLLCLESYLGMLQQYWGALYVKTIPIPLLDSIVPNVTCAYWYKKPLTSVASDGTTVLRNDPPGKGFVPVPLALPDPGMAVKSPSYAFRLDRQNPSTWYYDGVPYYIPRTMELLVQALNYWGSSYTDAWLPIVGNIYPRRPYGDGEHPLQVGRTFAQIDSEKSTINGTDITENSSEAVSAEARDILNAVFTEPLLKYMEDWQRYYGEARRLLLEYLIDGFAQYGEAPSTVARFLELQGLNMGNPSVLPYDTWRTSNTEFLNAMQNLWQAWYGMVTTMTDAGPDPYGALFDRVMSALTEAGRLLQGYPGSIGPDESYMVAPSYAPDYMAGVPSQWNVAMGESFVAYRVDTSSGAVQSIYSGADSTVEGDSVKVTYPVNGAAFVMFPSDYTDVEVFKQRVLPFTGIASQVEVSVTGVTEGKQVGDAFDDEGTLLGYVFPVGMVPPVETRIVGELPDALGMRHSCGVSSVDGYGNMFLPTGTVPLSLEEDVPPDTFVSLYRSFLETGSTANEELSDVVGYSIDHGREIKFPCFGIYGDLLSMQSWHYKEMPYKTFRQSYMRVRPGSDLFYKITDPSKIVYYHSSYVSASRQLQIAVYHEYLEKVEKSYGTSDSYTFYVFPCESISVSVIPDSIGVGSVLSVDALAPNGKKYHYVPMRNPIPKCAKYVDPDKWSVMDIVHELYLLAINLAGLCGDNGERLRTLEDDLSEFGMSEPRFIGQLPENNGQYAMFRFDLFADYAERIETLVNSVYELRSQIISATNTL